MLESSQKVAYHESDFLLDDEAREMLVSIRLLLSVTGQDIRTGSSAVIPPATNL